MLGLRELQKDFGRALLGGSADGIAPAVVDDGIAADARLDIYRHHVVASLTAALASTFPVVRRLVDERFFAYAADTFVRSHPPAGPCLYEYGDELPDFLASFPPCRHLVYLADVARLEWALNVAAHADDAPPLPPAALADLDPARVGDLRFDLDPSLTLLQSPWPVETIWRANQAEPGAEATVDLDAGGTWLQVWRRDDEVVLAPLSEASHAFRRALLEGRTLGAASSAALAVDPAFDLAAELTALLAENLLTGFALSPAREG